MVLWLPQVLQGAYDHGVGTGEPCSDRCGSVQEAALPGVPVRVSLMQAVPPGTGTGTPFPSKFPITYRNSGITVITHRAGTE